MALGVVGKRLHDQRIAVEDHLPATGDVGKAGETEERVVPLRPFGLPRLAVATEVVPRTEAGVVVDPDQIAVDALTRAVVEQVGHHETELHVAGRVGHPFERLEIRVAAVRRAHRAFALVEPVLVPSQEIDTEKRRAQIAEVGDVTLDVFLGAVAGGIDPLQQPTAVEEVARVDNVAHLDVGPADDGDR